MTVGNGSYVRVTRGVTSALAELDLLSGVVPIDCLDEWSAEYDGAMADIAIVVAPQTAQVAAQVAMMGMHERRLMLLPMNSSACPESMLRLTEPLSGRDRHAPLVTGWLTPSRWSAEQLRRLTQAPVTVWRHGVGASFAPDDGRLDELRQSRADGEFSVLHMTSTPRQRKGTVQLIQAWSRLVEAGKLPRKSRLTMILSSIGAGSEIEARLALLDPDVAKSIEVVRTPLDMSEGDAAWLYSGYHAIAQPSRGEGFGMVPLEALCCGVPVVATACSGHSEFLSADTPGLALVEHGANSKMDDGPGAMAPSVSVDAVASALVRAAEDWSALSDAAQKNAANMRQQWSWSNVMRQWAIKEGWIHT